MRTPPVPQIRISHLTPAPSYISSSPLSSPRGPPCEPSRRSLGSASISRCTASPASSLCSRTRQIWLESAGAVYCTSVRISEFRVRISQGMNNLSMSRCTASHASSLCSRMRQIWLDSAQASGSVNRSPEQSGGPELSSPHPSNIRCP
jgi:hypothetical protein